MPVILSLAYVLVFIWLLHRISFFKTGVLPESSLTIALGLKLIAGGAIAYIYTYYYTQRNLSDIYKYFDDGKAMANAFRSHPADFFHMLLGLDHDPKYELNYYSHMLSWTGRYANASGSETHVIIRLQALLHLFSKGIFPVHQVFFSFLTLCGLWAFYKALLPWMKNKENTFFWFLICTPGVLFWGSSMFRESFLLLPLGLSLYASFQLIFPQHYTLEQPRSKGRILIFYLLLAFSLVFVALAKALLLITALGGIAIGQYRRWYSVKANFLLLATFIGIGLAAMLARGQLFPDATHPSGPLYELSQKQHNAIAQSLGGYYLRHNNNFIRVDFTQFKKLRDLHNSCYQLPSNFHFYWFELTHLYDTIQAIAPNSHLGMRTAEYAPDTFQLTETLQPANSYVKTPWLTPHPRTFIQAIPNAFFNALCRPLPLEGHSLLMHMAAFENCLLLLAIAVILLCAFNPNYLPKFFKQQTPPDENTLNHGDLPAILESEHLLQFWFAVAIIGYFICIGWVTPNLGTIVRYKVPVLPLLVTLFVLSLPAIKPKK